MRHTIYIGMLSAILAASVAEAQAQVGEPFIHDPSTIAECDGKYYTFGTGDGGLWSADGWTWQSGAVRPGRGATPDVLKIGDRYFVAYSATGGGLGGSHAGDVLTMWNKTLDPKSPDFHYTQPVVVASPSYRSIPQQCGQRDVARWLQGGDCCQSSEDRTMPFRKIY